MAIRGRLRRFVTSRFGAIFAGGVAMMIFWFVLIGLLGMHGGDTGRVLFNMTLAHLAGGRASGIAIGRSAGLSVPMLIFAASYIDVTIVLTCFPVIVSGYRMLVRLGVFGELVKEALRSADESKGKVSKYGIVGLFLFVVFPFYMTGPLVGSLIAYFLGWNLAVSLVVVNAATIAAIVAWTFLFNEVYGWFEGFGGIFGKLIPALVVTAIIAGAVVTRVRAYVKSRAAAAPGGAGGASAGAPKAPPEPEPNGKDGEGTTSG